MPPVKNRVAAPRAAPSARRLTAAAKRRVLVVDDEVSMRNMLVEMLELDGYEVKAAGDGKKALRELEIASYHLILSDMHMPSMGGPDLFLEVERRWPEMARRFVFMTGDDLNDDTRRFLARVPTPNLNKPFDLDALHRVVARVLASR